MMTSHFTSLGLASSLRVPRALAGASAVALLCAATAPASAQSTEKAHLSKAFYSYCCTHGGYDTGWTTRRIEVDDGVVSASVRSNPRFEVMTGSTGVGFSPRPGTGDRIIYMNNYIANSAADVIFANSDSVAVGTGVSLRLTVKARLSGSESPTGPGRASFEGGIRGVNAILINDNHPRVGRQITQVAERFDLIAVGGSWSFSQLLYMGASIDLNTTDPYSANWTGRSRLFIDVLTPGVTLSSASGHDYSTPLAMSMVGGGSITAVPEPGSWAMLALGLGAVAATVRRATRRRNAP